MRIRIRKTGVPLYPWEVSCPFCRGEQIHVVIGLGAVAVNTRGLGNRSHRSALRAAQAHIQYHKSKGA